MPNQPTEKSNQKSYKLSIIVGLIIIAVFIGYFMSSKKKDEEQEKAELESKIIQGIAPSVDELKISYGEKYLSSIDNISMFEPGEKWQGNGVIDKNIFSEGTSSLSLIADKQNPAIISFNKKINLENSEEIEFFINIDNPNEIEKAIVKFGDAEMKNFYHYSFAHLAKKAGWTVISIPIKQLNIEKDSKLNLSQISKTQIEIYAKIDQTIMANIDAMTIIRDKSYLNEWTQDNKEFLGLIKKEKNIFLNARGETTGKIAILQQTKGARNFAYSASIIPQKKGSSGLYFRGNRLGKGYYFVINGIDTSSWKIYKANKILAEGELENIVFSNQDKYWLKVEAKDEKLNGFISTNGQEYTELFSIKDDEYESGHVGITSQNTSSFFNDFDFKQL